MSTRGKKLGELLIERGVIDESQLHGALAYQRRWGHRLGTALVARGVLSEGQLCQVLGEALSLPVIELCGVDVDAAALRLVRPRFCEANDLFPVALSRDRGQRTLTLAMADPLNVPAIDEVEFTSGAAVRPVLATFSAIRASIRRHYHGRHDIEVPPLSAPARARSEPSASPDPGPSPSTANGASDNGALAGGPTIGAPLGGSAIGTSAGGRAGPARGRELRGLGSLDAELERLQAIERRFWALLRVLERKGLVAPAEILSELEED